MPMEIEHYNSTMIKAEIAVEILAKNGIIVNEKEAENILESLYFLVKMSVNQMVKN